MNAADIIFGMVYRAPVPEEEDDIEEVSEWPLELYIQLLENCRERALIGLGLDPGEYSWESEEIPWGPYENDPADVWAVELVDP